MPVKKTRPDAATTAVPKAVNEVDRFLAASEHPRKTEIEALRRIILSADPGIGEAIKWNAPSFHTAQHFATLNLRAQKGIGVILHFCAKKRDLSTTGVAIPDPAGLLEWLAKDRATVAFRDVEDIAAKRSAFVQLLREWIKHV